MFKDEPSASELAEWFSHVTLHKDMEHQRYVGGIVVIENFQTKQWNPFPLAAVRVAYFWDWVDVNGYVAHVLTSEPRIFELPYKKGEVEGEKYAEAPALYIETTVNVYKPSADGELGSKGVLVRTATARKTVDPGTLRGPRNAKRKVPDFDALMKAETGSLARACAMLGMLTLPGSGIASAEDIHEFLREEAAEAASAPAGKAGGEAPPAEPARGGRAPNPKRRAAPADVGTA